jgi:hypothetical protein
MSQHMLRFLQVLYLEFVLVEVCLALLQFLSDLQPLLLKHVYLLDLLLELCLDLPLLFPGFLHQTLGLLQLPLEMLHLSLHFFLVSKILLILFLESLTILSMFLLDFNYLILVVILHPVDLLIVDILQVLSSLL